MRNAWSLKPLVKTLNSKCILSYIWNRVFCRNVAPEIFSTHLSVHLRKTRTFLTRSSKRFQKKRSSICALSKNHPFSPHHLRPSFLFLSALPSPLAPPVSVLFLTFCTIIRCVEYKKAKKKKRENVIKSYAYKYIIPTPCFSMYFFFFFHIGYYYYYYYYYYHIITITINTTTITITLPLLLLLINCYYVVYRVVKFSGSQRSTRDEVISRLWRTRTK